MSDKLSGRLRLRVLNAFGGKHKDQGATLLNDVEKTIDKADQGWIQTVCISQD